MASFQITKEKRANSKFAYMFFCTRVCVHRFSDPGANEREREDHTRPAWLFVSEEGRRETVFPLLQTSYHLHPRLRRKTSHH